MSDFIELARSLNLLSEQTGNRLSRLRKTKLLDFAFEASFAYHGEVMPRTLASSLWRIHR
jgi:hypothetical protein